MKSLKLFTTLFVLLLSLSSYAKTMCICQTGSQPENQVKFFKAGCKAWFAGHTCDEKKTVSQDVDLFAILSDDYIGGNLDLGYVGHWSSSSETVKFLKKVVPVAKVMNLDVNIDNTACSGMSNAFEVQDYLSAVKQKGLKNKITFKGNQITSLGMWDSFLPGKYSLPAIASTDIGKVSYPSCKSFATSGCSSKYQDKEEGLCVNEVQKLERLICSSVKREVIQTNERDVGAKRTVTNQEWVVSSEAISKFELKILDDKGQSVDENIVEKNSKVNFKIMNNKEVVTTITGPYSIMKDVYTNYVNTLNLGTASFEANIQKWNETN